MRRLHVGLATLAVSIGVLVVPALTPAGASERPSVASPFTPNKGIAITLGYANKLTDAQSMTIASSLMSLVANTLHGNAVSLNFPVWQQGSFANNPERAPMTPSPARMIAITEVAHRYHLNVQWRPYLFEGDLRFNTHNSIHPTDVAEWFQSYWSFLRPYLVAASQANVSSFSIAVELRSMLPFLGDWTNLVRRAKSVYSGEILYSQQHEPEVSIPLTGRGYDAYQPIKLSSPKKVSVAAFTRGFERNLRVPGSQSSPADLTLEEVGLTATARAYEHPAQSSFPHGTKIVRKVQTDWFDGACNAFWALHLQGIYFYSIAFDRYRGPHENDSASYGGWLGTPTETAIESCFARTAAPVAPASGSADANAPSVGWDPASQLEPADGHAAGLSCPTSSFCAEADLAGAVRTETAGTWSAPVTLDADALTSVSCASASLCVAVDDAGNAFTYNGTSWTERAAVSPDPLAAVSCAVGTTTCAAVDAGGDAILERAGTWSAPSPIADAPLSAVSCASASFCVAVDDAGNAYTYASSWSGPHRISEAALTAIACPSVGFCVAGDDAGHLLRDLEGGWISRSNAIPGGAVSMACASSTSCVAVSRGQLVSITDGISWSKPTTVFPGDEAVAVACAPAGTCSALSYGGLLSTSAKWSATTLVDPRPGEVTAVSCGTSTFCVAVDDAGGANTYDGTAWSAVAPTGLPSVSGISCAGTFCMAVSNDGDAVAYAHGAWGHPRLVDRLGPLTAVSCTSATFCAAVDATNRVVTFNGLFWGRVKAEDEGLSVVRGYTAISCATPAFCVAVDTHGDALMITGGQYSVVQADTPGVPITSISCPTATWCVAVDDQGREVTYNATGAHPGWTLSLAIDPYRLTSVSCTAAKTCLATDDDGGTVALANGVWATSSRSVPLEGTLSADSCAGTGTCAVTTASEAAVGVVT